MCCPRSDTCPIRDRATRMRSVRSELVWSVLTLTAVSQIQNLYIVDGAGDVCKNSSMCARVLFFRTDAFALRVFILNVKRQCRHIRSNQRIRTHRWGLQCEYSLRDYISLTFISDYKDCLGKNCLQSIFR